ILERFQGLFIPPSHPSSNPPTTLANRFHTPSTTTDNPLFQVRHVSHIKPRHCACTFDYCLWLTTIGQFQTHIGVPCGDSHSNHMSEGLLSKHVAPCLQEQRHPLRVNVPMDNNSVVVSSITPAPCGSPEQPLACRKCLSQ
ncbi:hypothetical protein PTTG_29237, partial [Puccinia triticina 1-1 BBBD Race 1]